MKIATLNPTTTRWDSVRALGLNNFTCWCCKWTVAWLLPLTLPSFQLLHSFWSSPNLRFPTPPLGPKLVMLDRRLRCEVPAAVFLSTTSPPAIIPSPPLRVAEWVSSSVPHSGCHHLIHHQSMNPIHPRLPLFPADCSCDLAGLILHWTRGEECNLRALLQHHHHHHPCRPNQILFTPLHPNITRCKPSRQPSHPDELCSRNAASSQCQVATHASL